MTTLIELRARLMAVRTMHADTRTPDEIEAWKAEEELIRQLDTLLLERLNRRRAITRTPGVCGGRACIAGTRAPVWCLAGRDVDEVLETLPHLSRAQVEAALAYAAANPDEIAKDVAENRAEVRS